MPLTTVPSLRDHLVECLETAGRFDACALLGYPEHHNVGDHLIWLGALRWIASVRKARLSYASSIGGYSQHRLDSVLPEGPILLTGGGNFGDYWTRDQEFREKVVRLNPRRPIVILPQSVYFSTPASAESARRIFNSHSDLTLFVRDGVSAERAARYFPNCKVRLAPDMSLMLAGLFRQPSWESSVVRPMLWLKRDDREQADALSLPEQTRTRFRRAHWPDMNRWTRHLQRITRRAPWTLPLAQFFYGPPDLSDAAGPEGLEFFRSLETMPEAALQRRSVRMVMRSAAFLRSYRLVLTDRLHGHLLSALLGIPNILMPNSYHKNEAFFEAWMRQVPACRFAGSASEIEAAAGELTTGA